MVSTRLTTQFAFAVFLVAGIFVAPNALAQGTLDPVCGEVNTPTLTFNAPPAQEPIPPIVETRTIPASITYGVENGKSLTPVTVQVQASAEDATWASVSVSPSTFSFTPSQDGPTNVDLKFNVYVTLTGQAPAFATQNIRISASGNGGTCVKAPEDMTGENINIQADFYERFNAAFDQTTFKTSQNDRVAIPLTITNIGNGAIEMRPRINADLTSSKLSIAAPALITVNTQIQGAERDRETVNIEVQTPFKNGYVNERHNLVVDLEGNSADKKAVALNTKLQLSAVIQTQGVYVPGFDTVGMLGASAIGLAFLARRRL